MAYASWSVVFGEQPSAAKWNILGTNDASFNDGTGIADGAITVAKRTGGFKVGITGIDFTTTGNKSVTSVGFTPKLVRFTVGRHSSSDTFGGWGAMDDSGNQWYVANDHDASANDGGTISGNDACLGVVNLVGGTLDMKASYVSMDADGFTINVSNAATGINQVYFEAYA